MGTTHRYGFWFFVPEGWKDFELVGGYATGRGVFNNYGVFFNHADNAPKAIAGGLVIYQNPVRKTVIIFLGRTIPHPDAVELETKLIVVMRKYHRYMLDKEVKDRIAAIAGPPNSDATHKSIA